MTQLVKSARSGVVRWYARLIEQKAARSCWYDVDHCGLH